jgi:hypothetical protein
MKVSESLEIVIETQFCASEAGDVISLLEGASFPMVGDNRFRIHVALIILARGNFPDFVQALKIAQSDWRDVLMGAGLAGENWREVASSHGFSSE